MKNLTWLFTFALFSSLATAQEGTPTVPSFEPVTDEYFTTDHSVGRLPKGYNLSSVERNVVAISGFPVPKGATHYYYRGESVLYLGGKITPTEWPVSPRYIESVASFTLPEQSLPALGRRFEGRPEVANHALMELLDEPIGPLSLDAPIWTGLPADDRLAKEVAKNPFSAIQAIFENSAKPERKDVSTNTAWAGRCVFRLAPEIETGAMLALRVKDQHVMPSLFTSSSASELMSDKAAAQPTKYTDMGEQVLELAKEEVIEEVRKSHLSDRSLNDHVNDPNSLFFEAKRIFNNGIQRTGFRLRSFSSTTKKKILVLEAYSPHPGGAMIGDERIEFMDPVQYCFFTNAYHW